MTKIRIWALAATMLAAAPGWSAESNVYRFEGWQGDFQYDDPEDWKEGAVTLPPYPKDGDLLEVPLERRGYDFFIDAKHLSVGDDGVTRYTLVIRSSSGAKNVFFEGIRCVSQTYRGYGYGSSDGTFHPLKQSEWRSVRAADAFGYRRELARFFLCDTTTLPFPAERVIDRIEHAEEQSFSSESRSLFD